MELSGNAWNLNRSPEEAENAMIQLFAQIYASTIEAFVERYGQSVLDLAREAFISSMVEPIKKGEAPFSNRDLNTFIEWLISGICVGHRGEFVEKTDQSVKFCFTSCPYATIFRQIGKEEIGRFFCDADGPLINAFNDKIQFERHHTLMDGDDHCDHHYYTAEK